MQPELLEHVPPDAVYRRVPLDDAQNALGPWREAIDRLVKPGEADLAWCGHACGEGAVGGESVKFPTGRQGERIRKLLHENERMLELVDLGIERERLQLPEPRKAEGSGDALGIGLHAICRVRLLKSGSLLADRQFAAAARENIHVLRMGEMICNGDAAVCPYLIGSWIRHSGAYGVDLMARQDGVPATVLRELLCAVEDSIRFPDGFAQCLRMDFCYDWLPPLERLSDPGQLEPFVDCLLEEFYAKPGSGECEEAADIDSRLAERRRQVLFLLRGHRDPFDKVATARLLGDKVVEMIRRQRSARTARLLDLSGQWRRLRRYLREWRLYRQVAIWPHQLAPGLPFSFFGASQTTRAKQAESDAEVDAEVNAELDAEIAGEMRIPTERELATARRRLRKICNPVGLLLRYVAFGYINPDVMTNHRPLLEETKPILAKRLTGRR